MLVKCYPEKSNSGHVLQKLILSDNDLTASGVVNVMKIVMKCKSIIMYCILLSILVN